MDFIKKIGLLIGTLLIACSAYSNVGVIRFGIMSFYPPYVFKGEHGGASGFDVELAQLLCKKMNAQCTFTAMTLPDLFESLKNHNIDAIISAIYVTPERKKLYDFTVPYFKDSMSYLGLAKSNITITPDGLKNKSVGVFTASVFDAYLSKAYSGIVVVKTYTDTIKQLQDLENRLINLVMFDTATAKYFAETSKNMLKLVGGPVYMATDEGYAIAVAKDNKALLKALNDQLKQVKTKNEINTLKKKYFGL